MLPGDAAAGADAADGELSVSNQLFSDANTASYTVAVAAPLESM